MAKNQRVYRLEPAGLLDRTDARVLAHAGAEVQKVQPTGCPTNGTMGMVYVQTLDGEFIGLVSKHSLKQTAKTAPLRNLAKEKRDREDAERAEARAARQRERIRVIR